MRNALIHQHEDVPRAVIANAANYPPHARLPRHAHKRGQLLYASAGVVSVETVEGSWVVPPKRALWIPPGVAHAVRMSGKVSTHSAYVAATAAAAIGLPARCRVIAVSPLLHALLMAAVDLPTEYALHGRDDRLMRLLLDELAAMPTLSLSTPLPAEPRLRALCRALMEQPSLAIDVDAMAARAGMSRRSFTRHFRQQTGMGYAAWRQQACLLAALARLERGQPVTQVALDLGYASPSAFAAAFRRVLGASPRDYMR